jgi:ubiquinone/menaquinone biosynthesis C-methylase UbiE
MQARAEELPIKPESVDFVFMRAVVNKVDVETLFKEMAVVLKPGGELRICPVFDGDKEKRNILDALKLIDKDMFEFEWKAGKFNKYGQHVDVSHRRDMFILRKKSRK